MLTTALLLLKSSLFLSLHLSGSLSSFPKPLSAEEEQDYLARCINLGRHVEYDGGAGQALDVDPEGRLVVRDLPLTVALDSAGGDLYVSGPAAYLDSLCEK